MKNASEKKVDEAFPKNVFAEWYCRVFNVAKKNIPEMRLRNPITYREILELLEPYADELLRVRRLISSELVSLEALKRLSKLLHDMKHPSISDADWKFVNEVLEEEIEGRQKLIGDKP